MSTPAEDRLREERTAVADAVIPAPGLDKIRARTKTKGGRK